MKVDVFSLKKTLAPEVKTRILVPHGDNLTNLPDEIKTKAGGFTFMATLDIQKDENLPRIALDTNEALANLEKVGYHIQDVKIDFSIDTTIGS